ncbi:hypothetical protein TorRG33x02_074990 [Trema orientale]|uniref:Uncharacterized protein n=1 Tax=Trema orientale TaxID=63057 RepID=A0A2P5FG70_TREOI|nr:hypothetical protein TorRG33x02_074990 [Trema orientale]
MVDLVGYWNSMNIPEEEENTLLLIEGVADLEYSLIGNKGLTKKTFNKSIFKEVKMRMWKTEKGLNIQEVASDAFILSFTNEVEKERVLDQRTLKFLQRHS